MSKYRISINGKTYEMELERIDDSIERQNAAAPAVKASQSAAPVPSTASAAPAAPVNKPSAGSGDVTSPMAGTILRVNAVDGQRVNAGETVLILEAMKMENEIQAESSGVITLAVREGQTVASGETLFSIN